MGTSAASADDVTPPLSAGDLWTAERIAWLRRFHRDRRSGLDGPTREATWAVVLADRVVGSVRLQRTEDLGVLETGIWLSRPVRGRGVGRAALAEVVRRAAVVPAVAVRAETTTADQTALALLRSLGFDLTASPHGRVVSALLVLDPVVSSSR